MAEDAPLVEETAPTTEPSRRQSQIATMVETLAVTAKETGTKAMNKAKEINEQHKITERVKAGVAAGVTKAKELDEQHQITNKTKAAGMTAFGMAKAAYASGKAKATELNEKYDVTGKAKAAGVTAMATAQGVNEKYGITESAKKAAGAAKNVVMGNEVFRAEVEYSDQPSTVTLCYNQDRTVASVNITVLESEETTSTDVNAELVCTVAGDDVTLGDMVLTFADHATAVEFSAQVHRLQ